jgi:micrococcal nuclease
MGKRSYKFWFLIIGVIYLCLLFIAICIADAAESIIVTPDRIVSVYDGDTFRVHIPEYPELFQNMPVRIAGMDTPEIRGTTGCLQDKAQKAKAYLAKRLKQATTIELANPSIEKYGRILATVLIDGKNIATEMINAGLAVQYDGKAKPVWNCK